MTLKSDVQLLEDWSRTWLHNFHPDKYHIITLRKFENTKYTHRYKICGYEIEHVFEEKDIGVVFDSELSFKEHICENVRDSRSRRYKTKCDCELQSESPSKIIYVRFFFLASSLQWCCCCIATASSLSSSMLIAVKSGTSSNAYLYSPSLLSSLPLDSTESTGISFKLPQFTNLKKYFYPHPNLPLQLSKVPLMDKS